MTNELESDRVEPGAEPISLAAQHLLNHPRDEGPTYTELAAHLDAAHTVILEMVRRHPDPVESGHVVLNHYIEEARRLVDQCDPSHVESAPEESEPVDAAV